MGFRRVEAYEPNNKLSWCSVEFDGAELMIEQHEDVTLKNDRDIDIYIVCADVSPIHEQWLQKGLKVSQIHDAFYGMRQIFVTDPDGRRVCFESPTPVLKSESQKKTVAT